MTLNEKQFKFMEMAGKLIAFAYAQGYTLSGGDLWSKPEYKAHTEKSCHYVRLAIDLNLFKDGKYLTKTADHKPLGEYWESLGGSWGGRFGDGNHYSLEHEGRR
ncbi:hypothetical protein R80B4_00979 [Fibrobacteres bacterium R8-0-B4]